MPTTLLYDGDLYRPPPLFTLAAYFYSLLYAHAAIDYAVYGAVEARFALVIRHSVTLHGCRALSAWSQLASPVRGGFRVTV